MSTALLHLVAAALIISGLDKLRAPRPASIAWGAAGLPAPSGPVGGWIPGLALGVVELSVGISAVATNARAAAVAVAMLYVGFAWFVKRLSSREDSVGCGCFGASSAPPGRAHLVLDLGAALAAVVAAVAGTESISGVTAEGVTVTVPYIVLLVIGGVLLLLGPALTAEFRDLRSGPSPRTFALDTEVPARH